LFNGLKYANAAEGGIITSTTTAVIAVLSFLLLKERLKINKIIGVIFSVLGVLVINLTVDLSSTNQIIGSIFVILGITFISKEPIYETNK